MKKLICALALILTVSVLLAANNPIPSGSGGSNLGPTNGITASTGTNIADAVSKANDVAASNAYTKRVLGSANVWTNGQTFQPLTPMQAGTFRRATVGQTNNILEVQAQDNTPLMWVTKDGSIYQNGTNIFDLLGSGTGGSVDTNSAIAFASDVSSDGTIRASGYETTGTNAGYWAIKSGTGATNITLDGASGTVTATAFAGDGSALTGISAAAIVGLSTNGFPETTNSAINSTTGNGVFGGSAFTNQSMTSGGVGWDQLGGGRFVSGKFIHPSGRTHLTENPIGYTEYKGYSGHRFILSDDSVPLLIDTNAVIVYGKIYGNGSGVTNVPLTSASGVGLQLGAFTNIIAGRIPIVISNVTYYLTLSTNAP